MSSTAWLWVADTEGWTNIFVVTVPASLRRATGDGKLPVAQNPFKFVANNWLMHISSMLLCGNLSQAVELYFVQSAVVLIVVIIVQSNTCVMGVTLSLKCLKSVC